MVDFAQPLSAFLQPAREWPNVGVRNLSEVDCAIHSVGSNVWIWKRFPFEHISQNVAKEHQSFFASLHPFCQLEAPALQKTIPKGPK